MSFNSYKPFKKRNLTIKFFLIFILGIFSTLIFTNALTIVTGINNAVQYIAQIVLTNDGTVSGTTGVVLDGGGQRVGTEFYCNLDFTKCVRADQIITGAALDEFKNSDLDPLFVNLSGRITSLSGSLLDYARLTALNSLSGSLNTLSRANLGACASNQIPKLDDGGTLRSCSSDTSILTGSLTGGKLTLTQTDSNNIEVDLDSRYSTDFTVLSGKINFTQGDNPVTIVNLTDLLKGQSDVEGPLECIQGDIAFVGGKYKGCSENRSRTGLGNLVD